MYTKKKTVLNRVQLLELLRSKTDNGKEPFFLFILFLLGFSLPSAPLSCLPLTKSL